MSEEYTVLALDLGTKTGVAFGPRPLASTVWNLTPRRFEGGGMRFLKFRTQLDQMRDTLPNLRVYFEEVRSHKGTDAAHIYGGLLATLTSWCEEHDIPYAGIGVGSIKKYWTGKGNAGKDLMIAEAVRRGYAVKDDNEADAIAIRDMALAGALPL